MAKLAQGGIPRRVLALEQPAPATVVAVEQPNWFTHACGEMGHGRIDTYDKVKVVDECRSLAEVAPFCGKVMNPRAAGEFGGRRALLQAEEAAAADRDQLCHER